MVERSETRQNRCGECKAQCCQYIAVEIDTPTCKRDYDNIRWYLLHENIRVFIDHNRIWHLEFMAPCKKLTKNYQCSDYANRPKICREYPDADSFCEFEGEETPYATLFTTVEKFEHWLKTRKINWQWKRLK